MDFRQMFNELIKIAGKKDVQTSINSIKSAMKTKKVNINDVLLEVNSGELDVGETIIVEGIISPFAVVEDTYTFTQQRILFKDFTENETTIQGKVKPLTIQKISETEDECMRFIYSKEESSPLYFFDNIDKANKTNSRVGISSANKYIPLLISGRDFIDRNLGFYRVKCIIRELPSSKQELIQNKRQELADIKKSFFDSSYPVYTGIYLEVIEIKLKDKEPKFENEGNVSFDVEYRINTEGSKEYVNKKIGKCLNRIAMPYSKTKKVGGKAYPYVQTVSENELTHFILDRNKTPVYIVQKDNYISISIDYNMREIDKFKKDYIDLINISKKLQECFRGNLEMVFISDENKRNDFL